MTTPAALLLSWFTLLSAVYAKEKCRTSEIPTFDGESTSCNSLRPGHGLAAMKWLTTPSSTCDGGEMENILGKYPTCSNWRRSLKENRPCNVIIVEDKTYCSSTSHDLLDYWGGQGCKVRYVPTSMNTICAKKLLSEFKDPMKVLLRASNLTRKSEDVVDVMYFTSGRDSNHSRSLWRFADIIETVNLHIKQLVMVLDYTCVGARGYGNELSFPGQNFYKLYYALSGPENLGSFRNVGTLKHPGTSYKHSRCFRDIFNSVGLDPDAGGYVSTFQRIDASNSKRAPLQELLTPQMEFNIEFTFNSILNIEYALPPYCVVPRNDTEADEIKQYIIKELSQHCQTMLGHQANGCVQYDSIDPLTPFMPEVVTNLASDYAWAKGWCSVQKGLTDIPAYEGFDLEAIQLQQALSGFKPAKRRNGLISASNIRFAFLITAYKDKHHVMRLLSRIYSRRHVYVVAVDKNYPEFALEMKKLVKKLGENVVVVLPMAVVYMTSSVATILVHGMAWMLQHLEGWDYMITLTGTDYPLQKISEMEQKLSKRKIPMPSIVPWNNRKIWTDGIRSYRGSGSELERARAAIGILAEERSGGASERRGAEQFGFPLTSDNQNLLMRYTGRQRNQWLFGKDAFQKYGLPNVQLNPRKSRLPIDGVFRVWYKSDPGTTAVYDRVSVDYIVNSEEGVKYYHFFKHMLVGCEEHYFISLLNNWNRTSRFIQSVEAIPVWNTWLHGVRDPQEANKVTREGKRRKNIVHTSFLSINQFNITRGLRTIGVFFARKLTSAATTMLDKIDKEFLQWNDNAA